MLSILVSCEEGFTKQVADAMQELQSGCVKNVLEDPACTVIAEVDSEEVVENIKKIEHVAAVNANEQRHTL